MGFKEDQAEYKKKVKERGGMLKCMNCGSTMGLVKLAKGEYACRECIIEAYNRRSK